MPAQLQRASVWQAVRLQSHRCWSGVGIGPAADRL